MALNMNNATYGRDTAGLTKLKANLNGDIKNAKKVLKGEEYKTFINTVNANWVGEDADQFLKNFNASLNTISKKFEEYEKVLNSALDADAKAFAKGQADNASSMKRV